MKENDRHTEKLGSGWLWALMDAEAAIKLNTFMYIIKVLRRQIYHPQLNKAG